MSRHITFAVALIIALLVIASGSWFVATNIESFTVTSDGILKLSACLAAAMALVLGLADLSGKLDVEGQPRTTLLTKITIVCVAILTELVAVEHVKASADLQEHLLSDAVKALDGIENRVDAEMLRIYGAQLRNDREELQSALKGVVAIENQESFEALFKRALLEYKGARLRSTSHASREHFWTTRRQQMIRDFLSDGADQNSRIQVIFFVSESVRSDDCSEDSLAVMQEQIDYGAEVSVLPGDNLGIDYKLLLFDEGRRFGWRVLTTADKAISSAELTTDPKRISEYEEAWSKLLDRNPLSLQGWVARCRDRRLNTPADLTQ